MLLMMDDCFMQRCSSVRDKMNHHAAVYITKKFGIQFDVLYVGYYFFDNNLVNTQEIYVIMERSGIRSYYNIRMFGMDAYFLAGMQQERQIFQWVLGYQHG